MEKVKTSFLCDEYKRIELQDKIGDEGRRNVTARNRNEGFFSTERHCSKKKNGSHHINGMLFAVDSRLLNKYTSKFVF